MKNLILLCLQAVNVCVLKTSNLYNYNQGQIADPTPWSQNRWTEQEEDYGDRAGQDGHCQTLMARSIMCTSLWRRWTILPILSDQTVSSCLTWACWCFNYTIHLTFPTTKETLLLIPRKELQVPVIEAYQKFINLSYCAPFILHYSLFLTPCPGFIDTP